MIPPLTAPAADLPAWARNSVNLADMRLGAVALTCSDDFFAPMSRLLAPDAAQFFPGRYDDNGKWMDGWESRRRRSGGNDWCVVRLACPGQLVGVDIDTSFFTGNYPPAAALEGCLAGADPLLESSWQTLLPVTALTGNAHHLLPLPSTTPSISHVRLQIFPDGGVARLRVYGQPQQGGLRPNEEGLYELSALVGGGRAEVWNDAHFGTPDKLLLPGRGLDMGDGWETRRRREPGHDWCVIALGAPGVPVLIEVDTAHFKGNFPDRCSLQGAWLPDAAPAALPAQSQFWPTLLSEQPLSADSIHHFNLEGAAAVTHVRFNLHPDGGVSRLRVWGQPVDLP
ncbi:allantoicase [Rhodobacteraceae bacterium CH30]|nr:allantoicase [Rhodobacteraceae bacterium CH30]